MNDEERRYFDGQFTAVHKRLTAMDERITQNARERLKDFEDLAGDLEEHKERNHGASKTLSGGIAGAIAAAVLAVYEALKRLG